MKMMENGWRKCENEAGFPYYTRDENHQIRQWDHPAFQDVLTKMNQHSVIRYAIYRMAYKIISIQEKLQVPSCKIISGVFSHHCLSISESSFVLEPCELEAILTDIYFAANKDGSFDGNVDQAAEITLNFLLNVYDSNRSSSVSLQSAKTALVIVSSDSVRDKWRFLFSMMADHNACISPRRLAALLTQIALLAEYAGEKIHFGTHLVQAEVDKCFTKTPGMLGLSEHGLFEWLEAETVPLLLGWMDVRERIQHVHTSPASSQANNNNGNISWKCATCALKNPMGLKFKCMRCWGVVVCEKCYLYNDLKPIIGIHKHKRSHVVKEIIDSQAMPSTCVISFVRNVKKVLNCPSACRRGNNTAIQYPLQANNAQEQEASPCEEEAAQGKENQAKKHNKVFTSTVGKSAGHTMADPKVILQDIIAQLENQNKALKNISSILNTVQVNSMDRRIQHKVDSHFGMIATQINRLKIFKENLLPNCDVISTGSDPSEANSHNQTALQGQSMGIQSFEVFSPIPVMAKECVNEMTVMEHKDIKEDQADGGNKPDQGVTVSQTPGVHVVTDSISNVSMSDISTWFGNETDAEKTVAKDGVVRTVQAGSVRTEKPNSFSVRIGSVTSQDKFNADLESVTTSNNKMKELNADLDSVLDRLQTILANNFTLDETSFDNIQLKETANEMEGLLGTLIRGVEQRRTIRGDKI